MAPIVTARGLSKRYRKHLAVDHIDFDIHAGRIVGLIGPNGAGKSTTLKAILGLTRYQGDLTVLEQEPRCKRAKLMRKVSYLSDVSTLPEWIKVSQLLILMRGIHPAFREDIARDFLSRTEIKQQHKVKQLSKGMKTQLRLALVMAIDASLLVLDEPTLGLDILYRKKFYAQLLNEYFDEQRTILITTHQIEEVEHILTDIMFMHKGRLILNMPVDDIDRHFVQVVVDSEHLKAAQALDPLHGVEILNQTRLIYKDADVEQLETLGALSVPSLADLFIACVEGFSPANDSGDFAVVTGGVK